MLGRLPLWWFHFITCVCIFTSTAIYSIDFEKRQLRKPGLCLKIFVYLPCFLCTCLLPLAIIDSLSQDRLFFQNIVAIYVNWMTIFVRFLLYGVFVLGLCHRNGRIGHWLEKVLKLQASYFDGHAEVPKDMQHRKWLYFNSLLACTHYGLESYLTGDSDRGDEILTDWAQVSLFVMVNVQHFYMLQHATLLCYLRECSSQLRHQLATKEITTRLNLVYNQLRNLYEELNDIFGPLISIILLCSFLTNSMVGYVMLMYLKLPNFQIDLYLYLFGNGLYFWLLLHWYIYVMLCDRVESAIKDIDWVIYEYTTEKESQQEIELIVFSRCLRWPGTNICHLIDINRGHLFCCLAQTLSYIITLIQCDYVNLI